MNERMAGVCACHTYDNCTCCFSEGCSSWLWHLGYCSLLYKLHGLLEGGLIQTENVLKHRWKFSIEGGRAGNDNNNLNHLK